MLLNSRRSFALMCRLVLLLVALPAFVGVFVPGSPSQADDVPPFAIPDLIVSNVHAEVTFEQVAGDIAPTRPIVVSGYTISAISTLTPTQTEKSTIHYQFYVECLAGQTVYGDDQTVEVPGAPPPYGVTADVRGTVTIPDQCPSTGASFDGWVGIRTGPAAGEYNQESDVYFSCSIDGSLPGAALPIVGAAGTVALWRAVEPGELSSLRSTGRYTIPPGAVEGKYFFATREEAESYAARAKQYGLADSYTITQAEVDESVLVGTTSSVDLGAEGTGLFIYGEEAVAQIELVAIIE